MPLQSGLWVVRLRAPFERAVFASAASDALRHAASAELDTLLTQAGRKLATAQPAT
jgi:ribonuclease P protein component